MFSEGEKVAAAILAAKACTNPGTNLYGYVLAYREALKLMRQQEQDQDKPKTT